MWKTATIAATLLLAACGSEPQPAPTKPFQQPGIAFKVVPQSSAQCKARGKAYLASVEWTVPASDKTDLEIRLRSADGQVFLGTDKATGSQETGDWVEPGLWFLLVDRRKGETIAALQAGPSPCQ